MIGPEAIHRDVASYALGILDEADTIRFEEHLVDCVTCAVELESLLPVTAMMSQVDGDSLVSAEERVRDGRMLDEMVNAVAYDRSRVRARRFLALAAGVVAIVLVGGLALITGAALGGGDEPRQVAQGPVTASPKKADDGPGIGGPIDVPGERFSATDAATKVHADVVLDSTEWGTQVSLLVSKISGPLTCQLVAVGDDGLGEVIYTWSVPKKGYGTDENPEPLFLQGATALTRAQMERMEIQSVDQNGRTGLLVSVPV